MFAIAPSPVVAASPKRASAATAAPAPAASSAAASNGRVSSSLRATAPASPAANTVPASPSSASSSPTPLPPMVRRLLSASRASGSRPSSATGRLTSTREMKSQAMRTGAVSATGGSVATTEPASPAAAAAAAQPASPSAFQTATPLSDLGPIYSAFQSAAQLSSATLSSGSFPASVRTAFERSSYWARSPGKYSADLGPIAWIFLGYACRTPADAALVRTLAELEDPALKLSFRSLLFLLTDLGAMALSSKARVATLWQRYASRDADAPFSSAQDEGEDDRGLDYSSFCLLVAQMGLDFLPQLLPQRAGSSRENPKDAPPEAVVFHSPRSRCCVWLRSLRWDDIEWVSSALTSREGVQWFRLRQALPDARSTFVSKPSGSLRKDRVKPNWAPLEQQVVAGLVDRPSVLHLDPHRRPTAREAKKMMNAAPQAAAPVAAASASATPPAPRPASALSLLGRDAPRPSTDPPADLAASLAVVRDLQFLKLAQSWCDYPGCYVDMGEVIVRAPGADAGEPKEHRYTIAIQNLSDAVAKVSVDPVGCDWMAVEYKPRTLALGMSQKITLRAPTHWPHGLDATAAGDGRGVECLGSIAVTLENTWTYETTRLDIPVYARLVVKTDAISKGRSASAAAAQRAPQLALTAGKNGPQAATREWTVRDEEEKEA